MKAQFVSGVGLPPTDLPYSVGVKVGDLVYTSGMVSSAPDGKLVPGTFEEEFRRTITNLKAVLQAAGTSIDRVFQVKAYLANADDFPRYNELYREVFKPPFPIRTTLVGCTHPSVKFEMEVVATCGG